MAKTIPIPREDFHLFVAQVVDHVFISDKKKGVKIDKIIDRFEEILNEQEEYRKTIKSKPVS